MFLKNISTLLKAQKSLRTPTVLVDLDGTLAEEKHDQLSLNEPMPGAREAMQALIDAGYRVVIFTCRMNREGRPEYAMQSQKKIIEKWLKKHEIPFSEVDEGKNGKPRGDYFIDNKAISYGGNPSDWESITKKIMSEGGSGG